MSDSTNVKDTSGNLAEIENLSVSFMTDAGHLELDGYAGDAIGADGDLVVTLVGQNSVVESQAPDADISQCGMEVWGDLTLSGTGSLAASGSQCLLRRSRSSLAKWSSLRLRFTELSSSFFMSNMIETISVPDSSHSLKT